METLPPYQENIFEELNNNKDIQNLIKDISLKFTGKEEHVVEIILHHIKNMSKCRRIKVDNVFYVCQNVIHLLAIKKFREGD